MEEIINQYENSPTEKTIRVLLFDDSGSGKLQRELESTGKLEILNKRLNEDEIALYMRVNAPEMVIYYVRETASLKSFRDTLIILQNLQMNLRTVILADNPLVYIEYALKTGVAALLHRQMDLRDLILVIHEIYAWYRYLPKPRESLACSTNLVLRLNQEVDNM